MYLDVDKKGRVLIPAAWRRELGIKGRIQAERKEGKVELRAGSEENFFVKYAGYLGKKYKIKPMTAKEFDDAVEKAMAADAAKKFG